jgi:uncharacterized protein
LYLAPVEVLTYIFFFLIAALYSSVGFGGGSLYTALLAQSMDEVASIRLTSLSCNTLVTANGSYLFFRAGYLRFKKTLPILLCSVPLCLWASSFELSSVVFRSFLAFFLALAALGMYVQSQQKASALQAPNLSSWWIYPIGSVVGFVSGLTGIGGGIYLAPILYFLRWGSEKEMAALCSLFIAINSIFGILGQLWFHENTLGVELFYPLLAVFLGGQLGSRLGAYRFSPQKVRYVTIALLIFASLRIAWKILFA